VLTYKLSAFSNSSSISTHACANARDGFDSESWCETCRNGRRGAGFFIADPVVNGRLARGDRRAGVGGIISGGESSSVDEPESLARLNSFRRDRPGAGVEGRSVSLSVVEVDDENGDRKGAEDVGCGGNACSAGILYCCFGAPFLRRRTCFARAAEVNRCPSLMSNHRHSQSRHLRLYPSSEVVKEVRLGSCRLRHDSPPLDEAVWRPACLSLLFREISRGLGQTELIHPQFPRVVE